MSGILLKHLLNCYLGVGIFRLNTIEVNFGLKDVTLIAGLNVIFPIYQPRTSDYEQAFINQSCVLDK